MGKVCVVSSEPSTENFEMKAAHITTHFNNDKEKLDKEPMQNTFSNTLVINNNTT